MFSIFQRKPYAQQIADEYMSRATASVESVNELHRGD